MQEPAEKDETNGVGSNAGGEEERRRHCCRLVVGHDRQLHSGGHHDDAAEEWQEDVAKGLDREPGSPLFGRSLHGTLSSLLIAAEIEPPECGGEGQAQ